MPTSRRAPGRSRGRPPRAPDALDRPRILAAALAQIDAQGLAAFNIRALAAALGVAPAALYWHVPNRAALVSGAIGIALGDVAHALPGGSWQQRLQTLMRRFRDALRRHPNLAPAVASELTQLGSVDAAQVEEILGLLGEAGFDDAGIVDAFNVVVAALCGFATLELSTAPADADSDADGPSALRAHLDALDATRFPRFAHHKAALRNRAFLLRWTGGRQAPLASGFEAWIDVIVRGLEARLAGRPPARGRLGAAHRLKKNSPST